MKDPLLWLLRIAFSVMISFGLAKSIKYVVPYIGIASSGQSIAQAEISTFFASLLCSIGVNIALQGRKERNEFIKVGLEQTQQTVKDSIDDSLAVAILGKLHSNLSANRFVGRFKELLLKANSTPEETTSVVAAFLERKLLENSKQIDELFADGVEMPIDDHIAMTEQLVNEFGSYTQIQRKAFLVPEEWTGEWIAFLSRMGKNSVTSQYILVASIESQSKDKEKIESMAKLLKKHKVIFKICDLADVTDSRASDVGRSQTVELIGSKVLKLVATPPHNYKGGIVLKLSLGTAVSRPELMKYANSVLHHSVEYSASRG